MYYLNQKIENLVRIFDQNERKSYLRLDLNENPGGLPEEFVNGVLGDVTPQLIAQYPETLHFTEVLAQYLGTDIQHLCLVNGSAEGIRYIIQAFTSENGKIVGVVPSYFMFQVYSEMYGRNFVKVPYNKDLTMSIENIITQLTDDTQLLILLNPNIRWEMSIQTKNSKLLCRYVRKNRLQFSLMKRIIISTRKHLFSMR